VLATVVCLLVGIICYAGKAAPAGLFVFAAAAILHGAIQKKSLPNLVEAPWSVPFGLILLLAAYVGLSSLWALAPHSARLTAVSLIATALVVVVLVHFIRNWSTTTARLVGGWQIVGPVRHWTGRTTRRAARGQGDGAGRLTDGFRDRHPDVRLWTSTAGAA